MGKTYRQEKNYSPRAPKKKSKQRSKRRDIKYYGGLSWKEIKELLEETEE